jgi:hypothetical protein
MIRAVVALTAVTTTACTHQRDFRTLPDAAGRQVTVATQNGAEVEAHVDVSSVGYGLRLPDGQVLPFEQVREVVAVKRGRGALEGLGLGALGGAGLGVVMGLASGDDQCDEDGHNWCILTFTAEEKAVLFGFMMGSLGGLIGLVAGAIRGSRDVYSFGSEQQFKITPSGPPGSVAGATITF